MLSDTLMFIIAIAIIFVHSFHSWKNQTQGNPLLTSFHQFIHSTHHITISSAIAEAVQSKAHEIDVLCKAIADIVLKNPLGITT
jgi:hypothetical protein